MDTRRFLHILQSRWPIVVVLTLVLAALGYVLAPEPDERLATRNQGLTIFEAANLSFTQTSNPAGLTPAQIRFFLEFDEVPADVTDRIGGDPQVVASQVRLDFDTEIGLLRVVATNPDPERAVEVADVFTEELIRWLTERATDDLVQRRNAAERRVTEAEDRIRELDDQIAAAGFTDAEILRAEREAVFVQLRNAREQLASIGNAPSVGIVPARSAQARPISGPAYVAQVIENAGLPQSIVIEDAVTPPRTVSSGPPAVVFAALGAIVGLFLGLAIVFVIARLDKKIRSRRDAEVSSGIPVVAEIPNTGRLGRDEPLVIHRPRSEVAEAYRVLRTTLTMVRRPMVGGVGANGSLVGLGLDTIQDLEAVMIASPGHGDGKTTVTANLGAALAELGRVLVVDADIHRPQLAEVLQVRDVRHFGGENAEDLEDAFESFVHETDVPNLHFATTAPSGGLEVLSTVGLVAAQRAMIDWGRDLYDMVLVDTAPLSASNDGYELVNSVDATLLVARVGRTTMPGAEVVTERLDRLGAPMAGCVLLGANSTPGSVASPYYTDAMASPRDSGARAPAHA